MSKIVNWMTGSRSVYLLLKLLTLSVFVLIIIVGFTANSSDKQLLMQLRFTNTANLVVWSLWWPLIIVFAIFFGRLWCAVCPVEVITSLFSKIGLKRKPNRFMQSGWFITIFYITILFIGIQGFAAHRNPTYMSIYLLIIVIVSIAVGLFYQKNAFCRYVCPVGNLLKLYSRVSAFGWGVNSPDICSSCKDKSCVNSIHQYSLVNKSCGIGLYPAKLDSPSDCILCGGCRRSCSKFQDKSPSPLRPNPEYKYTGFASELYKLKPFSSAEFFFVLIVSGFVISEVWTEWGITRNILYYIPNMLIYHWSLTNQFVIGFLKGFIVFFIFPILVWAVPFLVLKISKSNINIRQYLYGYGIAFIPLLAMGHLCKAVLKSTNRIPIISHLNPIDDISGIDAAQNIVNGTIKLQSNPAWLSLIISVMVVLAMAIGVYLSVKCIQRINNKIEINSKLIYLIPIIYGAIILSMLICWRVILLW